MKGHWHISKQSISMNEGGTPINFHIRWSPFFFIYLYAFGKRWHYASR
jgi:hypothetical protein